MRRHRLLCLTLLMGAAACGAPSPSDDAQPSPSHTPAPAGCPELTVECPAGAKELGQAGAFRSVTETVTWKYCAAGQYSWADFLYRSIPTDTISFAITIDHGSAKTAFARLGTASETFVDEHTWGKPPFGHEPTESATVVFPMTGTTAPPTGECVGVLPIVEGNVEGQTGNVHFVSRRSGQGQGLVDLNLIVVDAVDITQTELDDAVTVMADLYYNANAGDVGSVTTIPVSGSAFINAEGPDIQALRAFDPGGDSRYMNLYFISDFLGESGTLGIAAGIPGPLGVHETGGSGVVMAIDSHVQGGVLDVDMLGATMAHEVGHQMGLRHTSESDGTAHDFLPDTPECTTAQDANGDNSLTADECINQDGTYMMFWGAGSQPQSDVSQVQSDVIFLSPIAR